MKKKIKFADLAFDIVGAIIFLAHIFMSFYGMYYDLLPAPLMVLFFVCTRSAMGSIGHYHTHRAKNGYTDWGEALFDMQYVAANVVIFDGHVLVHHMYTNTRADVKRTVFTAMLDLPRLTRVPIYTIHRFGQLITGMIIRWVSLKLEKYSNWSLLKHSQFWIVRILMIAEFFFAY